MAISFPLSLANLADLLPVERADWNEFRQEATSPLGSGEFLTIDLAPPLWQADVASVPMPHATAEQMRARLASLNGSGQCFYLCNPVAKYPQADPTGAILGSSSVVINTIASNRKALSLSGLPAAYAITIGDYLAITYDTSRRALIQAAESVAAGGSGATAEFEVRPFLRPGITTTLAVTLAKPAAKVKIVPNTLSIERAEDALMSRVRFAARQTLAKD